MSNIHTYNDPKIVKGYSAFKFLFKAEQLILDEISETLSTSSFLDIGVGGGRTTHFFAPKCKLYVGLDYAQNMVDTCQKKFPNFTFKCHDAADMNSINEASFDYVLFSFNGIDSVNLEHRIKIFKEIYRVLKPDGKLIFSFHNTLYINKLYTLGIPKNPLNWIKEYKRVKMLNEVNGPKERYQNLDFFTIKDGADDFKLDISYLHPHFQIDMMTNLNYEVLKLLDTESGQTLMPKHLKTTTCPWIYMICLKK